MPKHQTSRGSAQLLCPYCSEAVKVAGGGLSNHFLRSPSCRRQRDKPGNTSKNVNGQDAEISGLGDHSTGSPGPSEAPLGNEDPDSERAGMERTGINGQNMEQDEDQTTVPGCRTEQGHAMGDTSYVIYEDSDAGHVRRDRQRTVFESLRDNKDPTNPSAPWKNEDEWALAEWLMSIQISQAIINRFLKLNWVCQ
jgi:hypothetical protein